jgi:hypothetical protein
MWWAVCCPRFPHHPTPITREAIGRITGAIDGAAKCSWSARPSARGQRGQVLVDNFVCPHHHRLKEHLTKNGFSASPEGSTQAPGALERE